MLLGETDIRPFTDLPPWLGTSEVSHDEESGRQSDRDRTRAAALPETARHARRSASAPGALERRGAARVGRAAAGTHRAARPALDLQSGAATGHRPGRRLRE